MKILAAGDLHGDFYAARALALKAQEEDVDLIILCGDIVDQDQNPNNTIGEFIKKNKKVLFLPGNHESFATANFLAELYGIKNLHATYLKYKDLGIFGCGGANIGIEHIGEDEVFSILQKNHDKIKMYKKRLMVTHVPPANSKMELMSKLITGLDIDLGSKGVRKAIEQLQPDIVLCSHLHEAEGIEEKIGKTEVINVGRTGRIIEI